MPSTEPAVFRTRSSVFALATLCCFLWGSAYPAIKNGYALLHIAPSDIASQMLFAGWRFALAGLILLLVTSPARSCSPVGASSWPGSFSWQSPR